MAISARIHSNGKPSRDDALEAKVTAGRGGRARGLSFDDAAPIRVRVLDVGASTDRHEVDI